MSEWAAPPPVFGPQPIFKFSEKCLHVIKALIGMKFGTC